MGIIYRYAQWAEEQADDFDDPFLIAFPKFVVFIGVPAVAMAMVVVVLLMVAIVLFIQFVPWVWDLVWI